MFLFYVHIVESPSPDDLMIGINEGKLVSEAFRIIGIKSSYYLAVTKDKFIQAITQGIPQAVNSCRLFPILHISAHGDENGIVLTDGASIQWNELREILKPVNEGLMGGLSICLSSCSGYAGYKMAKASEEDIPFYGIVGPLHELSWEDSAIAFAVFYNRLSKVGLVKMAVSAMNAASGGNNFGFVRSEQVREAYLKLLQGIKLQQFQEQLKNLK